MSDRRRVRILCEDRRSERFFRGLCKRYQVEVLDVLIAPKGKGSGADWVINHFPAMVRQRRSKNFQEGLGLLVHVDGDDRGVAARKLQLEARLVEVELEPRSAQESVGVFVPTWCIETWLLHLSGIAQPPETAKLKRDEDPGLRPAMRQYESSEADAMRDAVVGWRAAPPPIQSLADAYVEAPRLGLS